MAHELVLHVGENFGSTWIMAIHRFDAYVGSLKCAACVWGCACVLHPFRSPVPTSPWPRSPSPTPGRCHFKIYCGEESLPTGHRGKDGPVVSVAALRSVWERWVCLYETMRGGETTHLVPGTRKAVGDAWNQPLLNLSAIIQTAHPDWLRRGERKRKMKSWMATRGHLGASGQEGWQERSGRARRGALSEKLRVSWCTGGDFSSYPRCL